MRQKKNSKAITTGGFSTSYTVLRTLEDLLLGVALFKCGLEARVNPSRCDVNNTEKVRIDAFQANRRSRLYASGCSNVAVGRFNVRSSPKRLPAPPIG